MNTDTPLTDTPLTDAMWEDESQNILDFSRDLERRLATIVGENLLAIDILDGNADRIDWRDPSQPELLRKLCEHLEAYEH